MLTSLWSFLGLPELPPPVNFIGVRIPADRSPPRLVALRTTNDSVFHAAQNPDLRPFWGTGTPWEFRDRSRIELKHQPFESCNGLYYVFFSFAEDDLPENMNMAKFPDEEHQKWWGDVFIVKVQKYVELGTNDLLVYEDVPREFLDLELITKGGLGRVRTGNGGYTG
jgi:hypothetical protein